MPVQRIQRNRRHRQQPAEQVHPRPMPKRADRQKSHQHSQQRHFVRCPNHAHPPASVSPAEQSKLLTNLPPNNPSLLSPLQAVKLAPPPVLPVESATCPCNLSPSPSLQPMRLTHRDASRSEASRSSICARIERGGRYGNLLGAT